MMVAQGARRGRALFGRWPSLSSRHLLAVTLLAGLVVLLFAPLPARASVDAASLVTSRQPATADTTSMSAEYIYDALGRRIATVVDGVTTRFLYGTGTEVLEERAADGSVSARYTHGAGIDEPLRMERDGNAYTYHRDSQGSVTALSDGSGSPVEQYEYDVYGEPHAFDAAGAPLPGSVAGNSYLFTGRRLDVETATYHYRARSYHPEQGRFLQSDPLGYSASSLNLYQYVDDNPQRFVDPLGLDKTRRPPRKKPMGRPRRWDRPWPPPYASRAGARPGSSGTGGAEPPKQRRPLWPKPRPTPAVADPPFELVAPDPLLPRHRPLTDAELRSPGFPGRGDDGLDEVPFNKYPDRSGAVGNRGSPAPGPFLYVPDAEKYTQPIPAVPTPGGAAGEPWIELELPPSPLSLLPAPAAYVIGSQVSLADICAPPAPPPSPLALTVHIAEMQMIDFAYAYFGFWERAYALDPDDPRHIQYLDPLGFLPITRIAPHLPPPGSF